MTTPFEAIAEARDVLRAGLAALDRVHEGDELAALDHVNRVLGELADPSALRETVDPDDLDRFDDELEEVARLNAVLVSAAASERDRLVDKLSQVRSTRRDLGRHTVKSETSGARCDIAG